MAILSVGVPVLAQEQSGGDQMEEILVVGVRQALRDSIITKKNTDLVSDNISTNDIGQLPDVTIAEELARLPGVNFTRDRGNASQAAVRGLGPRFVFGLVNGREVASSEPSQDVRWEIYPSEVLSGAQVYKSQDATLVPGGIAATIDIRTISPLDYHGPSFSIRGGPTYNDIANDLPHYDATGYRGSAGYVGHVNDNFAVSIAASVQKEKNGFPDFRTFNWNMPDESGGSTGDLNGDGTPDNTTWGLVSEIKEVTQDRGAISGSFGWRTGDNFTLKGDALWSQYQINENQFQNWYGNNVLGNWNNTNAGIYNAPGNSYDIVNGTVVAANLANIDAINGQGANYESAIAHYKERHTLAVAGLNAAWIAGDWTSEVDLSYSDAWRRNTWEAIYLTDAFAPNLVYDVEAGQSPTASLPGFDPLASLSAGGFRSTSGAGSNAINGFSANGQHDGPQETHDQLTALQLNFGRSLEGGFLSGFKFGGRFSDRSKTHEVFSYGLCVGTGSTVFGTPNNTNSQSCRPGSANATTGVGVVDLSNSGLESFQVPGVTAPDMVWGSFGELRPLLYPDNSVPAGAEQLNNHTKVAENTYEGYFKLDFKSQLGDYPLTGGLGLRVAKVDLTSSGFQTFDGGATWSPVSIDNDYTDVLPTLNMVLHFSDSQLLRFGVGVAISRPPLDALVTGYSISDPSGPPPFTGGGGNPLLRPYKSDQVDLSYEWYFHEESLLAVAVYYKDLKNMIGASQSTQDINGVLYTITSEDNMDGGGITGVEVTYQTRFHFLPGFLQDMGMYANYAYADSSIKEVAPASNPYPLVGLAQSTSQLDLFYNKGGFETRVGWKHHSSYTVAPTWVGTTLKTLFPEDILDAQVSYDFAKIWSVRFNCHNLTDERSTKASDNNDQLLSNDGGYQLYGRSYLLDVAVRF
ncbi:MAG TPA: TonB-dependent receptor [Steroidobacteraceae bacterium]|nr:TonB-dependent receptor [Steroidobacteraceae bacterium]